MGDEDILRRIGQLADEERDLEGAHVGDGLSEEDQGRLRSICRSTSVGTSCASARPAVTPAGIPTRRRCAPRAW